MNWLVTIAGVVAAFVVVGHFAVGAKQFLKPMLEADFDPVARKVMHCVFHYVSVFIVLSCIALLALGTGMVVVEGGALLVRFIAVNFLLFAIWQIVLALRSGIAKPLTTFFQWIPFAIIDICAWLGARMM
jgi:hypothetical protein